MKQGHHVPVLASFSKTKKLEIVKIIQVYQGQNFQVIYPNGHMEVLPLQAFIY